MRVSKCPQPPLLAAASCTGALPRLLSAQGTQLDLWQLGVAHNREQHVRKPCHIQLIRLFCRLFISMFW